jgi:hypothetical protein
VRQPEEFTMSWANLDSLRLRRSRGSSRMQWR